MKKPVLLRTDAELKMGDRFRDELEGLVTIVTTPDDREETIARMAGEAEFIYMCYAPITATVMTAAPRLRGIIKYGVGLDSVDLVAAAERGIAVVHCPDYGTETVAEHAFGLLMSLARRMHVIDRDMQREGWLWPEPRYIASEMHGKTLGLLGLGRIGKAVARRATGFGMRILACDPYIDPQAFQLPGLEYVDFDRLICESDFLSLHCILTDETRGIINRDVLRRMRNHALLIDVSRGALIDEADLVWALQSQEIGGAALDVFTTEPLTRDHPLYRFSNVLLTPHFAFYSQEAYDRLEGECFAAVRDLLAGKTPPHTVTADKIAEYSRQ